MRGLTIALIALAVAAVSLRWGSFVAGGSDSYCYVHQAERWAAVLRRPLAERLQTPEPLALEAPWPEAPLTFAPTGHIASPTVRGAIVPICPPGLPMAMAAFVLFGGRDAAFHVMPVFGALLIVATYLAGSRFGARVGVASAALVACSPAFLYQVVQPMSDVPAAALWLTAVALATGTRRRDAALAGLATSAAILVRPNLVPLGVVIGLFLLLRPERSWSLRGRSAIAYALGSAPGCVAVLLVHDALYGSPLSSGYGSAGFLFAADHIVPNVQRYVSWLWQSHTPAIALALLAPLLVPGSLSALFAALFFTNLALYLPYVVFENWSYVRFLLPAIPLLLILLAASVDSAFRRAAFRFNGPTRLASPKGPIVSNVGLAVVVSVLAVLFVREAAARSTFDLRTAERRFETAGQFVADRLPANAFLVTSYQSGSIRHYSGRKTLVWDTLEPAWFDQALAFLRRRGYEPYLVFERWEEPEFRRRFAGVPLGALDWPPAVEIASQVRIYRPDDRDRYVRGERVATEYVR